MDPSPPARVDVDALIRQYGELIRSVVRRVGGRRVALVEDDVRQQVIVALWNHLRREQSIESPASYVYRAAVRETVRAVRRELGQPWVGREDDASDVEPPAPTDPHREREAAEKAEAVERSLQSLPRDRARAVRAHLDGWSVEEIMKLHGWPYQKARNLIARGMADLRAALRERGIHG